MNMSLKHENNDTTDGYVAEKNMKPVAWRNLCVSNIGEDSEWIYNEIGQGEPLYTAPQCDGEVCGGCGAIRYDPICEPAPRELSDEEIKQIFADETGFVLDDSPMALLDFARAILKKASEK
jgi:hypothetical protein